MESAWAWCAIGFWACLWGNSQTRVPRPETPIWRRLLAPMALLALGTGYAMVVGRWSAAFPFPLAALCLLGLGFLDRRWRTQRPKTAPAGDVG